MTIHMVCIQYTKEDFMKLKLIKVVATLASVMFASTAVADIKVGFIGSLSSDTGLSTLRGAEIAIDELNAKGGIFWDSKLHL